MSVAHVVLDGADVFCRHCGERFAILPASVTFLMSVTKAFEKEHRRCKLTERSPASTQGRSPAAWLLGGDTGTSSITICIVMSGLGDRTRLGWPLDPDDFGRCYRLLTHFPAWRARMHEVAAAFPGTPWVAYVREWDRMTALYEEELPSGLAPKIYDLMQQLRGEQC